MSQVHVKRRISPFGIGPKIVLPSVLYAVFAAYVTYRYPGRFRITVAPSWAGDACGAGLLVAGIVFYAMSLRLVLKNMKRKALVTTGPYGVVRHPIYAAWILCIVPGIALVFRSWALLGASVVCYAGFRMFVHEEEDILESVFGRAYEGYRRSTPALFPACWILGTQRKPELPVFGGSNDGRRYGMAEFGNAFSGMASDRNLTEAELVRAIRFMVAAEYEAVQLYMQLAESTDNKLAIEVLKDIADEERVHAGEFLRLLKELAPDEEKFYAEGAQEVEETIEKA